MAIQHVYEETKQSIIHTYCIASDAAPDTYFAACIVKPVNAVGADGQVELAVDGKSTFAGVIHCPGRKRAYLAGDAVAIIRTGTVKVTSGGVVKHGDAITADANGKGVVAGAGDHIIGYARNTINAAGECIAVELNISKI